MSDPTAPAPERTACCGDHCTATATHGPGAFPVACWQHAGDWPEIPAPPPSEAPAPSEPARPVPLSTADLDGLERSLDAGRTWEPDEATARWVLGVLRRASEPAAPGGEVACDYCCGVGACPRCWGRAAVSRLAARVAELEAAARGKGAT